MKDEQAKEASPPEAGGHATTRLARLAAANAVRGEQHVQTLVEYAE